MSRLVVVSNRVADLESGAQSGGLAVAVSSMLEETGGLWFGWDGNVVDDDADRTPHIVKHDRATVATIPLSRNEYDSYTSDIPTRCCGRRFTTGSACSTTNRRSSR